jgi:deoxyribodipyrimidine photolyase
LIQKFYWREFIYCCAAINPKLNKKSDYSRPYLA